MADEIPTPEQPDLRAEARECLVRFLAIPELGAFARIAELNDQEVADVVAARDDRHTATEVIKTVLSRAYDRRREAAAVEAGARQQSHRRSALALAILQQVLGQSADESTNALGLLTADEIDLLASLPLESASAEAAGHILKAAVARQQPVASSQ